MEDLSREEVKRLITKLYREDPTISNTKLIEMIPSHPSVILDVVLELERSDVFRSGLYNI